MIGITRGNTGIRRHRTRTAIFSLHLCVMWKVALCADWRDWTNSAPAYIDDSILHCIPKGPTSDFGGLLILETLLLAIHYLCNSTIAMGMDMGMDMGMIWIWLWALALLLLLSITYSLSLTLCHSVFSKSN